jgi:hypothetical protein
VGSAGARISGPSKIDDGWPADCFEQWYRQYPKKKQPDRAKTALDKVRRSKRISWPDLMAATHRFAANPGCEPQFIPHPASWLNAASWADEPDLPHVLNPQQPRNEAHRNGKPTVADVFDHIEDEIDRRTHAGDDRYEILAHDSGFRR